MLARFLIARSIYRLIEIYVMQKAMDDSHPPARRNTDNL